MPNIYTLLRNRAHGLPSRGLSTWVEDKIEDNLLTDHCRQSRMTLETRGWKDHQTSGDWVAILNSQDQLSLFNIESQKCVWSLPMTNAENHDYNKLIVFRDGTVIYLTKDQVTTYDLQIFQHGKKTGNIVIGYGFNLSSLRLVGDHILCTYNLRFHESALSVWDKSGSLLKRMIPYYPHYFSGETYATANDVFYVAANWEDDSSLFFIYNSNDRNARSVRLQDDNLRVNSIQIVNDKIICAAYRDRWENDSAFSIGYRRLIKDAEIIVLDANTGAVEKTFANQKKSSVISDIVANENYIVYRLIFDNRSAPEFHCIDRQTAETYPLPALSNHLDEDYKLISLTLTQRALSVHYELNLLQHDDLVRMLLSCDISQPANVQKPQGWLTYLGGFFSRRADREEMETKLVIREYQEIRFDSHAPVNQSSLTKSLFSNNKMMLFYSCDDNTEQLHIEDYLAEPEDKVDETCSARINRP